MKRIIYLIISLIFVIFALSGCANDKTERVSDTRYLLDTVCTITAGGNGAERMVSEAFDLVAGIEENIDYFNSKSTVAAFNSAPAGVPVRLDEHSEAIISAALEVSKASGGAFDITIAPVKDIWDFKSEEPNVPSIEQINAALPYVGYEKLIYDEENRALTKTEDGVKIDLGGCGKGYCCQAALDYIAENYPDCYAILDFGGNVGVYGENPRTDDGSFTVGIQNPNSSTGEYSQTVTITSGQSAVTSGTYQRHFVKYGVNYHHILDPKTGMPSNNGFNSATIVSDSGLSADCLSTACMTLPAEDGRALAEAFGAKVIYQ